MANPWDSDPVVQPRVAAPGANPWDADEIVDEGPGLDIDIVGGISESQAREQMLREMGLMPEQRSSRIERAMAGIGKSLVDTGQGLAQGVTNAVLPNQGLLEAGAAANPDSSLLGFLADIRKQQQASVARRRATDPSFSEDPVFGTGNIVGTLAQFLGPGIAARGSTVGSAILPTTIRGNAIQGGVIGGIQPVAAEGERGLNVGLGALGGTVGSAIPKAVGAATSPLRALLGQQTLSGAEKSAGRELLREATSPEAILQAQPSAVSGVSRTLGEETMDPGLAGLERMLRGRHPGQFAPIDLSNNAARTRLLEGIAGNDTAMAAAEATRSAASRTAREEAMQAGPVDISQTVRLLSDAIAEQEGRPAIQAGLRDVQRLLSQETEAAPGLVVGSPESRIAVLDNVRQTISDMLSGKYGGDSAKALAGSRALIEVRDSLNDEIASQVPRFGDYLSAYRSLSTPINRMEVGRELMRRGSGAVPDAQGNNPILPASFLRATEDLDGLAARATGFQKAKAADILSKQDISAIKAIQDDMQRVSVRNTSSTVGSPTDAYQQFGRRTARNMLQSTPVIGRFAELLDQQANQRLQERLAYLVANPAEARRVVSALNKQDRAVVNKALLQLMARPAAATPALAE